MRPFRTENSKAIYSTVNLVVRSTEMEKVLTKTRLGKKKDYKKFNPLCYFLSYPVFDFFFHLLNQVMSKKFCDLKKWINILCFYSTPKQRRKGLNKGTRGGGYNFIKPVSLIGPLMQKYTLNLTILISQQG